MQLASDLSPRASVLTLDLYLTGLLQRARETLKRGGLAGESGSLGASRFILSLLSLSLFPVWLRITSSRLLLPWDVAQAHGSSL